MASTPRPHREVPRAQGQLFEAPGGARAKYSALIVGRRGWGALLKYECVMTLTQTVPGALGLALRKLAYPWLLGSCGRNVVFGRDVVLRHPHRIHIGDNVVIDDHCLLDAKGEDNHGITIGSGVFVGRNTILSCKNGDITLGDGVNIGFNCEIFSGAAVTVGANTLMAAYCYLIGGDHEFRDPAQDVNTQPRHARGIVVGSGVWFGAGAKVLDGLTIGDRAIIGAGAVVRQSVPAGARAVGVPARLLQTPEH